LEQRVGCSYLGTLPLPKLFVCCITLGFCHNLGPFVSWLAGRAGLPRYGKLILLAILCPAREAHHPGLLRYSSRQAATVSDLTTPVKPMDPRKGPFRKSGGERQASKIGNISLSLVDAFLSFATDAHYAMAAQRKGQCRLIKTCISS
jgi:hypothetical protein